MTERSILPTRRPNRLPAITRAGALGVAGGLGALIIGGAAPASAHVTVTPTETAAGAYTVLTFAMGHGCEGSPTTELAIQIPAGINSVSPTRNSEYTVRKQMEALNPPATDSHGNEITERVAEVIYTAKKPLPDGFRDSFELSLQIPEDAAGETLAFPSIQTCVEGETGWTQLAADGEDSHDLETPAPVFTVTEAGDDGHDHGDGEDEGHEDETEPGAEPVADTSGSNNRATVEDSDSGSEVIGLVGAGSGIVALVVAGAALMQSRRAS